MACERPVIVAVDGQARQIVEEAGAGIFVEPGNSHALVNAIFDMASEPERRRTMGASGRQYIINRFSREKTAREYIKVLEELDSDQNGRMIRCDSGGHKDSPHTN